ncbi:MAG: hypothetical protein V5A44_01200 [Haloarculaceae archaeon]
METTDGPPNDRTPTVEDERPLVRAHSTSEERTVFTESGNGDGWIATDTTVEPTR